MPEHYEVRRMAEYLKDHGLVGQTLKQAEFKNKGQRILKGDLSMDLLMGSKLNDVKVKAKYTGFEFDNATLVMHYRFTGIPHLRGIPYGDRLQTIFSLPIKYSNPNHCRFTWGFDSLVLDFYDTRCLSVMSIHKGVCFNEIEQIMTLPDDVSQFMPYSFDLFKTATTKRKKQLKLWLLDQTVAPSGIGNYLACEILAYAKLDPFMLINELSESQFEQLMDAIVRVSSLAAQTPAYEWFKVFNRETCGFCDSTIHKQKVPAGSQTTHYCKNCLNLPI
ncbi:MAG: DNA-formamidopyrimidine glycosylase family protein [Candidatus Margulisiibacteriota bacterium]|nr:DNA-formamidopyrimidine glycosylase family protein [Candidatus Margulisiibacteriota bacterium]